jgi:hypothetical protein
MDEVDMTEQELALKAIQSFADQAHRPALATALGVAVDGILRAEHSKRAISQLVQQQLAELVMQFLIDVDDLVRKGDAS